jgi:hypothetical protein
MKRRRRRKMIAIFGKPGKADKACSPQNHSGLSQEQVHNLASNFCSLSLSLSLSLSPLSLYLISTYKSGMC